jgi:uncharacterized protein (DUF1697 family)
VTTVVIHVALIRGINVGGRHTVPMADLRARLAAAGMPEVATYIQSGNVIARSDLDGDGVGRTVADVIEERFGFRPAVTVRTVGQLAGVLERHPYLDRTTDHAKLHVYFCSQPPSPQGLAGIDHHRFAPDLLAHDGMELFAYFPKGMGRSKLVVDERALGTAVTARNLKTVAALVELASAH